MSLRKEIIKKLGENKDVKTIVEELLSSNPQQDKKKLRRYIYIVKRSLTKTVENLQPTEQPQETKEAEEEKNEEEVEG